MKLSIEKVAEYLNLPSSTVARWVRQGRIPIQKTGDSCSFDRATLEKWARQRNLFFGVPQETATPAPGIYPETLLTAMKRGGLVHQLRADSAAAALRAGVAHLPLLSDQDREILFDRLLEREQLTSTGIGKGVAIPHPRTPLGGGEYPTMVTTCFLESPLDFNAIDDRPVFVLFIILCPTLQQHLHILSRLAFCLRDTRFEALLQTRPPSESLLAKVREIEQTLEGSGRF
ncbi:MAG: PTS sugar transporter subunit IIA [Desulfobacteraceae bacterium]|jgi:PTS system nitrogen regulatory IIA component